MILNDTKRIVIKIGSSLLIKNNKVNTNWVNKLSEDIAKLSKKKLISLLLQVEQLHLDANF